MVTDLGVGELVTGLQKRGGRLPFEVGAFVALEACEGLLRSSVRVNADDVRVTPEGGVRLSPDAQSAGPNEAALSLMTVLSRLLMAAGPGVPPHLLDLVQESDETKASLDLQKLHDVIEASLIPLNRGASRRVLARLVRESERPPPMTPAQAEATSELDADLDELLEEMKPRTTWRSAPPPPPPTQIEAQLPSPPSRVEVPRPFPPARVEPHPSPPAMEAMSLDLPEEPSTEAGPTFPPSIEASEERASAAWLEETSKQPVTAAFIEERDEELDDTVDEEERPALRRPPRWRLIVLVAAAGAAMWGLVQSGRLDALLSDATSRWGASAIRTGAIEVSVSPPTAQVFVFAGRGPAIIDGVSIGQAHEFVVFDVGLRPTRVTIPPQATWARGPQGPLYELAVQAAPSEPGDGQALVLPAPLAAPPTQSSGETGRVRVVTNPPGAKVYRFVGVGPNVRIEHSSVDEGHELLIYEANHVPYRAVVGPSDWITGAQDGPTAPLRVDLPREVPPPGAPSDQAR